MSYTFRINLVNATLLRRTSEQPHW